ncbi:MAG TPA: iron-sulfur cluster assembly scaffold protein [Rubrobacter sp.]|nr:iron-sulfur cluster assembly scaffold protein [Rubrobacter sp.]
MDRKERVAFLVDHSGNPRHKGVLEGADVQMPGGSPECGGSVVVYLKGDGNGKIEGLSWTGQGDTISMGATSIAMERVRDEGLTVQQVLDLDYDAFVEGLGREVIGSRTRNATLGLSTLKAAIRAYQRDGRSKTGERAVG